ncbi:hypothetical protein [Anaerotignum sp.]|uniref:hypothetical protein n=1 Tax=Anaerotignum sp. TaxID=2039241 RepID=UPI00271547F7|nr:hypothetical protein [Anaerotignum sp.]
MIQSFSFRYGTHSGKMEWYRVEEEKGAFFMHIDKWDEKEYAYHGEVENGFLKALEEKIKVLGMAEWNGFRDIDACLCSGDSWVLHISYSYGQEVHAMGHSAYPKGFEAGVKGIEILFDKFLN